MESRFCQNCGAQLQPGDRFCQKCGHAVSENAGQQPLSYQPEPTRPQVSDTAPTARKSALPAVLALLAVLLLVGVVWYRMRADRTGASSPAGTAAGPGAQQGGQLYGYAGTWVFPPDGGSSSSMVITLQEDRGTITGSGSDGQMTVTMELKSDQGGKLSGTMTGDGTSFPVTANLSPDQSQLTLTVTDSSGRLTSITGQRQGASPSGSNPSGSGGTAPPAPQPGPSTDSPAVRYERDAVAMVQQLPEVSQWLTRVGPNNARFDVIDETSDHYTVLVYEVPAGGGAPGTVFGTYTVDKSTGRAYPSRP